MSQRLVSAVWAALVGALSGVVLLGLFYLLCPALRIEFEIDPPRLMTGMHQGERDEATGLTFAWTGRDVALRLPGPGSPGPLDHHRPRPWCADRAGRQSDDRVLRRWRAGPRASIGDGVRRS